jgi:AcrR family transcriptional regulator
MLEMAMPAQPRDRRVRRSRSALMRAAVDLVEQGGSAAVSITDIADEADVSRQVLYQQFGDRDTLLLESALDLVRQELLPALEEAPAEPALNGHTIGTAVRHFAEHRVFYRAMLTSSSSYALSNGLSQLFLPLYRQALQHSHAGRLSAEVIEDLATFAAGGVATLINDWLVNADDPLDSEQFTDRLMEVVAVIASP